MEESFEIAMTLKTLQVNGGSQCYRLIGGKIPHLGVRDE